MICIFNMASTSNLLFTSTNYFQWKSHMEDLLRSKGLYQITLGKETTPIDADKKSKWNNRNDEAHELIRMSISLDLRFHLQSLDQTKEAWDKIESVFVKQNIIREQQLENQVLTLSSNDFSCIEDYLSKFEILRLLCEECKIKIEEDHCIYLILSNLGSAYSLFVSTFYAMQEALGSAYKKPGLENFCGALIREKDKFVQLGVINTTGTSNKALVFHQKDTRKNTKKQHPRHNKKQYKGLKPTQIAFTPNGDKGEKYKSKNTNRHCQFCDKYGHDESKCFKKMKSLEAMMKKHNINIDSTSYSSSHGHALSTSGFSFNTTSTSTFTSDEWLIDFGASYHMAKDRAIFYTLNECNTKGLSIKYWVKAINYENYIVNHTPTKALKNITPEESWDKIKRDVSHFCVFGSITWAHIPDEKRKALQPKSEKCIFVGYSEDVKGYIFNHIVMKLLLEEMLNLMKMSWLVSLIRCL
jgi:hypothetical protein